MDVEVKDNVVHLSGFLNEGSDFSPFVAALTKASGLQADRRVIVDFAALESGNSIGILNYLKSIRKHPGSLTYRNVPSWLVEQFGLLHQLLAGDVLVESVIAQFYCPQTDANIDVVLRLGTDVPILTDYSDFLPTFKKNGNVYEADFDSDEFFLFITANIDLFRRQFKS